MQLYMRLFAPIMIVAGLALGGCASAAIHVDKPLSSGVGRVALSIQDGTSGAITPEQSDSFRAIVTKELQSAGIEVVPSGSGAPSVNGRVTEYVPGSQAARYWVGIFGAGHGSLASTWQVQDPAGQALGTCTITGHISIGMFGGHFEGVLEKVGMKLADFLKGPGE